MSTCVASRTRRVAGPFVMPVARPSIEDDTLARARNEGVVVADNDAKGSVADICVGQKEVGIQLFESHALLPQMRSSHLSHLSCTLSSTRRAASDMFVRCVQCTMVMSRMQSD